MPRQELDDPPTDHQVGESRLAKRQATSSHVQAEKHPRIPSIENKHTTSAPEPGIATHKNSANDHHEDEQNVEANVEEESIVPSKPKKRGSFKKTPVRNFIPNWPSDVTFDAKEEVLSIGMLLVFNFLFGMLF